MHAPYVHHRRFLLSHNHVRYLEAIICDRARILPQSPRSGRKWLTAGCLSVTIYIGLGANLASRFGPPKRTLQTALEYLEKQDIQIRARSRWYQCAAVPDPSEPAYINAVVEVATDKSPERLLATLHGIESDLGRVRRKRWESRSIDLDLLDYHGLCQTTERPEHGRVELPHPRMAIRSFVLLPLHDIAPDWRHPRTGESLGALIRALPAAPVAVPLPEA